MTAGKVKDFEVYAVSPKNVKNSDGSTNTDGLVYYSRGSKTLTDPDAVVYVTSDGYDEVKNQFKPGYIPEPLVLRANAGDLIKVKLTNKIPVPKGQSVGQRVGLHPQLLTFDVTTSDGFNGGNNTLQTADTPNAFKNYVWYAGNIKVASDGTVTGEPVEFGAVNLTPSDPASSTTQSQINHGLFGALVIEPEGAIWVPDTDSRAQATVTMGDGKTQFREFVLTIQDNVPVQPDVDPPMFPEAINYKTEPMGYRFNFPLSGIGGPGPDFSPYDITAATSNVVTVVNPYRVMPVFSDPQTPIFHAPVSCRSGSGSCTPAGRRTPPLTSTRTCGNGRRPRREPSRVFWVTILLRSGSGRWAACHPILSSTY